MKKSLIALAVLAASGAAMAQSTVTLYGVADVWLGASKAETSNAAGTVKDGVRQTRLNSGGYNGSRFGLRGTEDLGGGLAANFVLEQGFTIDDGAVASSGLQFNRQAFVGLSGGFGTTRFGRQYSAYDELRGATNNSFDTSFATTGTVWGSSVYDNATGTRTRLSGVADYSSRVDNQVYYASPVFGGFSGAIGYGFGEDKTTVADAKDKLSLHVKYAAGPLLVGVAYQNENVSNTVDRSYTLIAGSYDFGVAKVTAGYNRAKQDNYGKDNEYQLGVSVPVGGAAAVAVGYSSSKFKTAAGASAGKASGLSLTGYYDLSKRTRLYAGVNKVDTKNAAGAKTDNSSVYAVGMRHSF